MSVNLRAPVLRIDLDDAVDILEGGGGGVELVRISFLVEEYWVCVYQALPSVMKI